MTDLFDADVVQRVVEGLPEAVLRRAVEKCARPHTREDDLRFVRTVLGRDVWEGSGAGEGRGSDVPAAEEEAAFLAGALRRAVDAFDGAERSLSVTHRHPRFVLYFSTDMLYTMNAYAVGRDAAWASDAAREKVAEVVEAYNALVDRTERVPLARCTWLAAAMFAAIVVSRPFRDGNRRTAHLAAAYILRYRVPFPAAPSCSTQDLRGKDVLHVAGFVLAKIFEAIMMS